MKRATVRVIPTIVALCSCGKRFTLDEWEKLDLRGVQIPPAETEGPDEFLECRNCQCGSTRTRTISIESLIRLLNATVKELRASRSEKAVAVDTERARCLSLLGDFEREWEQAVEVARRHGFLEMLGRADVMRKEIVALRDQVRT